MIINVLGSNTRPAEPFLYAATSDFRRLGLANGAVDPPMCPHAVTVRGMVRPGIGALACLGYNIVLRPRALRVGRIMPM
jgi:hypothetical protein